MMFTLTEPSLSNLLISMLLPLSCIHFLSVPFWIKFHLIFKKAESRALSSRVRSGLITIGEGKELLFDKSSVAS